METTQKAGAQISARAFLQSVLILFVLMLVAGILTRVVPAGTYARTIQDGRQMIDPASFQFVAAPDYPVWRWFTAPLEVLGGPDGLTIATILLFLIMVGASFAVLDHTGILLAGVGRLVTAFGARKYLLLLAVSLFFMLIGAFFGIFEEVVPLVPLMIALAYYLGWDSLTGLGMSILATNIGFSAAITNPFTIGVAQKLAGLPLFSGAWLRVVIFLVMYGVFALFLVTYARKIERDVHASPVHAADAAARRKYGALGISELTVDSPRLGRAMLWFGVCVVLILLTLLAGPLLPAVSDYSLPLVGILFLVGGLGAGLLSGTRAGAVWRAAGQGILGIAPGIPLILMAASIKYIVAAGGIMDTVLHSASLRFAGATPFTAVTLMYGLALLIEFFVASGSAKAFLLIPILMPLADLVGVTRQAGVTAYCFGDGFSNLAYPTNPVLLICLGLTAVSYPVWLKWTAKLWAGILVVTLLFLGLAVAIHYGPF
jgi:uncharacterized ion transporter superfamily protein YfcC